MVLINYSSNIYRSIVNNKYVIKLRNIKNKKLILSIMTIIFILYIITSNLIGKVFSFFDYSSGSVYARVEGIIYYLSFFKQSPINFMGFVNGANNFTNEILHGKQGYLYTTDICILGELTILGILGLIWYIALVIKMIKLCYYKNENGKYVYININTGVVAFILLSSLTLIVLNSQRIILLPIILSIVEYNYRSRVERR